METVYYFHVWYGKTIEDYVRCNKMSALLESHGAEKVMVEDSRLGKMVHNYYTREFGDLKARDYRFRSVEQLRLAYEEARKAGDQHYGIWIAVDKGNGFYLGNDGVEFVADIKQKYDDLLAQRSKSKKTRKAKQAK